MVRINLFSYHKYPLTLGFYKYECKFEGSFCTWLVTVNGALFVGNDSGYVSFYEQNKAQIAPSI